MPGRIVSTRRRVAAALAGLVQAAVGLVLLIASVDSLGLVTDADFSVNWLVVPAGLVLASVGATVSCVAGYQNWLKVGLGTILIGAVIVYPASVLFGNILAGYVAVLVLQLTPALWPR